MKIEGWHLSEIDYAIRPIFRRVNAEPGMVVFSVARTAAYKLSGIQYDGLSNGLIVPRRDIYDTIEAAQQALELISKEIS